MVLAQPVGTTVYLPDASRAAPAARRSRGSRFPTSPGEQLDHPAPSIVVPANATTPTSAAVVAPTTEAAGPSTTDARMSVEQTPITQEGSPSSGAGLVVFIVVTVVIVGGAAILYLRHRKTGNTTTNRAPTDPTDPTDSTPTDSTPTV